MYYRKHPLTTDHYYHIYNRGVEKRNIFEDFKDYSRMEEVIQHYQYKNPQKLSHYKEQQKRNNEVQRSDGDKLVEIVCYCLMPNHFHLVVKQLTDDGITKFMNNFSNSYTRYFNTKYKRVGGLFQGPFKSVLVETDEQAMQLSRYIHLNPYNANLVNIDQIMDYTWSSLLEYAGLKDGFCAKEPILDYFENQDEYISFCREGIKYNKHVVSIEDIALDEEE